MVLPHPVTEWETTAMTRGALLLMTLTLAWAAGCDRPTATALKPQDARLLDARGESVLLRGVNLIGWQHARASSAVEQDFRQLRALGYNCVRITVATDEGLPRRTLVALDRALHAAERQGLHVVLHAPSQDATAWRLIALRVRRFACVAAYDITSAQVIPLSRTIAAADPRRARFESFRTDPSRADFDPGQQHQGDKDNPLQPPLPENPIPPSDPQAGRSTVLSLIAGDPPSLQSVRQSLAQQFDRIRQLLRNTAPNRGVLINADSEGCADLGGQDLARECQDRLAELGVHSVIGNHTLGATVNGRPDESLWPLLTLESPPIAENEGGSDEPPPPWSLSGTGHPSPGEARLRVRGQAALSIAANISFAHPSAGDRFHFVHQIVTGDTGVVAMLEDLRSDEPASVAGLMLRQNTDPDAPFAAIGLDAGGQVVELVRWVNAMRPERRVLGHAVPPIALAITRKGAQVSVHWTDAAGVWQSSTCRVSPPAVPSLFAGPVVLGPGKLLADFDQLSLIEAAATLPTLTVPPLANLLNAASDTSALRVTVATCYRYTVALQLDPSTPFAPEDRITLSLSAMRSSRPVTLAARAYPLSSLRPGVSHLLHVAACAPTQELRPSLTGHTVAGVTLQAVSLHNWPPQEP